jgi:hypothetical protein
MNALLALIAFIETPTGSALLAKIPTLVTDVIGIWQKSGVLTTQMVADYLASAPAFATLCPQRPAVVAVPLVVK